MHKILIVTLLTIVHWQCALAQFNDDFSDLNFTDNPTWSGNDNHFDISNSQLSLAADPVASSDYMATPSACINNASWEFLVVMDFNPSSANLTRVYLVSDQHDLSGSLSGYFVEVGNTEDDVCLYRQDGTTFNKIIDGLDKILNTTTVTVRIRVIRDSQGNWELLRDVGNQGSLVSEGIVPDNRYTSSSWFGVYCLYTSTRSDKFHFDNFEVTGDIYHDTTPPQLDSVMVLSNRELVLQFNEVMDQQTAATLTSYLMSPGGVRPVSATIQSDLTSVVLTFSSTFVSGQPYTIAITQLLDASGNQILPTQHAFTYFDVRDASWRDVEITEFMADPDPQIGLPNAEFIEIFNHRTFAVSLNDWVITDGSSVAHFPNLILQPNAYLVVTANVNKSSFSSANVVGLANFPTLNNSGDDIIIRNDHGILIDSIHYTPAWYGDGDKAQGGWSLEKIDLENTCGEESNWTASESIIGGTPGSINSVDANKPDLTGPVLQSAFATSNTIQLKFNEALDKTCPTLNDVQVTPALNLSTVAFNDGSRSSIVVTTMDTLKARTTYAVTVTVNDCSGNAAITPFNQLEVALPETADSLDVVINEVLFNPRPNGVDFVEVYNQSDKFIDIMNWSLGNTNSATVVNRKTMRTDHVLLKPHGYLAISIDKQIIASEYVHANEGNMIDVPSLPSLPDDEGNVAIVNDQGKVLDALTYTDKMHSVFLQQTEGVSLERISSSVATQDFSNWKSANADVGFATPGYLNSNTRVNSTLPEESIRIEPEAFMPVLGKPNFTEIQYHFDKGGYMAHVRILDVEGRTMKTLADNESLSTSGFFRWDGDLDNGQKAPVGYYVVQVSVFDDRGSVKTFNRRVVVATRL